MLHTTGAIVLRTFKHGDRTTVLKAYTELFGLRSYMVRNSAKGNVRNGLLQPLNRLELVVTETDDREMHAVREMRVERPYINVPSDHVRRLVLLFTQEFLYRTLLEERADAALFVFVGSVLEAMDTGADAAQVPLDLMVGMMHHLGIGPELPEKGENGFDMREGRFFRGDAPHEHCLPPELSQAFAILLMRNDGGRSPGFSKGYRRPLLDGLLTYYRLHMDGFGELRSPEVLHALMH